MNKNQQDLDLFKYSKNLERELKNNPIHKVLSPQKFAVPKGDAEKIALKLKKEKFKTTQLRKIFTLIKLLGEKNKKKVSEEGKSIIYELYVLMAYANGRENMGKPLLPNDFYYLLKTLLQAVEKSNEPKDFITLEKFITAIVAYSKHLEKK